MFSTIKGKIAIITMAMLIALMLVVTFFSYIYLSSGKNALLDLYSKATSVIAQDINKEIIIIESNARDLALMGSLFYTADRDTKKVEQVVKKIFDNYRVSLGGGIWFEPYKISKNEKRFCVYAYRNKNDEVVLDKEFNSDAYNYLNQLWYKEIFGKVSRGLKASWSSPYFEKVGSNTLMVTAGSGIYDANNKLVGISTVDWEISSIVKRVSEIKPTPNSFALFADVDNDYIIVSTDKHLNNAKLVGKSLKNIPWYADNLKQITYFTYQNRQFIPYVKTLDNNMVLIVCIPKTELFYKITAHVLILFLSMLFISGLMAYLLYLSLNKNILKPINTLTSMARKISKGDEIEIKIEKPEEFAQLASTFNKMTGSIKSITKERAKITSELSIAKSIQDSSLPNIFPPFPNRHEFDIYATMTSAKEVGGDFYDFYFLDNDHFMFLIADVSGKGIPASLFMMTAKTLIANLVQIGCDPKTFIQNINKKICETNKQGLFVTLLIGVVNLLTGKITYINCGHNHPLVKKQNYEYNYISLPSNIVLGAFADAKFEIHEEYLDKGDTIFFYTDGLTEADNGKELFGEKRLKNIVNKYDNIDLKQMANNIKNEIKDFSGENPQSDDITMLIFRYTKPDAKDIRLYKEEALKDNYKQFCTWLGNICKEWKLDEKLTNKLDMCAEEIYANISFYSYPDSVGYIEVYFIKENDNILLKFADSGIPYNPLEKPDPDITLPPEKRPLGGLGIFMVKEMADNISYEYVENKNILTLTFKTKQ